eukprot:9356395-Pyramimonas_sp.AAC.1
MVYSVQRPSWHSESSRREHALRDDLNAGLPAGPRGLGKQFTSELADLGETRNTVGPHRCERGFGRCACPRRPIQHTVGLRYKIEVGSGRVP